MKNEDGSAGAIFCDNGATVRALDAAFPGFISRNHCVDNSVIKGKAIEYSIDHMGVLEGFDVVEEGEAQ